jgi:hypothetical protein
MRAFKPLAKQHSYSAQKSAVETAGLGQTGPSMLAHTPPLTTLAHVAVGETREVGGRGEVCDSWQPAGPAGKPATPEEGRWGRHGGLTAIWLVCCTPCPQRGGGGETVGGAGVRMQEESSLPDEG